MMREELVLEGGENHVLVPIFWKNQRRPGIMREELVLKGGENHVLVPISQVE